MVVEKDVRHVEDQKLRGIRDGEPCGSGLEFDHLTPVGAPMEAVVDSAGTAEEGGSTLRRSHAFSHKDEYTFSDVLEEFYIWRF